MTAPPPAPSARRRLLLRGCVGSLVVAVAALAATYAGIRGSFAAEAPAADLPPAAWVSALPASFPKQGPNECGAYSLAYGLRAHGQEAEGPALVGRVSHRVAWSSALSGTLPWRLSTELEARGFQGAQYTAAGAPDAARLDLVRAHVARGDPVVVLIESERQTQHYVLVVGYAPGRLDLYDPNFEADPSRSARTVDANGGLPGNRSLDPEVFQDRWSRGGGAGLYRWWYLPISRG